MTIEELTAYLDAEIASWEASINRHPPESKLSFRIGYLTALQSVRFELMTTAELEAELDTAEAVPLSEERIAEMVRFATQGDPNGRSGLD